MKTFEELDIKYTLNFLFESCVVPPNYQRGLNKLREELPQLKNLEGFIDFCCSTGTRVIKRNMIARNLNPAQNVVDFDKVVNIVQDYTKSNVIEPIAIDKDNYIIDGHHRWSALMYINPNTEIPVYQFNIKLKNLISRKITSYELNKKLNA